MTSSPPGSDSPPSPPKYGFFKEHDMGYTFLLYEDSQIQWWKNEDWEREEGSPWSPPYLEDESLVFPIEFC